MCKDNRWLQIIKQYFQLTIHLFTVQTMSYIQKLDSIKPFINIFNIGFYGFYYFTTIFHTVPFTYSGCNFNTIKLI